MMILSLRDLFSEQQRPENPTLKWARNKEEGPKQISRFFETEQNPRWSRECAIELLTLIAKEPYNFENTDETVSLILDQGLDRHLIDWENENLDMMIWSMASNDPRPETSRAGALLVAELITHRLNKGEYRLPLHKLLNTGKSPEDMKRSIISIQNALVDLVTENKDSPCLIKGPEILALLQGDDDARLWSKKLSNIKTTEDSHPLAAGLTQSRLEYK